MLLYWSRSPVRNIRAYLLVIAFVVSMSMNVIEFTGLQGYWGDDVAYAGYLYNALLAGLFTVLAHLTIYVAYEKPPTMLLGRIVPLMYAYVLCLWTLLAGTDLVIADFELLGGYTITRIPGPLYPMFEVLAIATLLIVLALPLRGVRQKADARLCSRCQIWLLAAMPACLVVITVLILLRLNLRLFNATVTLPIPMTLLLMAIGYCVHSKRIIDLSAHLSFTKVWLRKNELHASLSNLAVKPSSASFDELLNRLASAIECPVALIDNSGVIAASTGADMGRVNIALHQIQEPLVTREASGAIKHKLSRQHVGAIIPLFATSEAARVWLIFGSAFDAHFYSPADFQLLDRVVKRLAGLLLDRYEPRVRQRSPALDAFDLYRKRDESAAKPLAERLATYEAFLIEEALASCSGNKARAARLLGLQPNTLHYKLKRLGLT